VTHRFQFASVFQFATVLILFAVAPGISLAQVHGGPMPNRVPAKQPKRADKQDKAARPVAAAGQHPLDRWRNLTPEQRQAQLAKLPPEKAANIQKRLDAWNKMTPDQQQVARSMTPEKRQLVSDHREWLLQQAPERQKAIVRQTQLLRQMSPEARQSEFESPTFKNRFDATEREHIKRIISIIPDSSQNIE
jgi:hypothetical protein